MNKTKKGSRVAPERPDTVIDIDKAGTSDNYGEKGAKTDDGIYRIEKEQTDVDYHHQADQWVDLKDETEHEKSKRKKKKRRKSIDVLSAQDELPQSHSQEMQRLDETEHEKSKRKKKKRRKSIDVVSAQDELPQSHSQEIQGLDIEQGERTDSHYVARVAKNCILIPYSNVVMYSKKVIRKQKRDWALLVGDVEMNLTNNKFEIEVIDTGDTQLITIGLVPADYDQNTAVGWHDDSFGYHAYDGGIYIKNRHPALKLTTAKKGDIISLKLLPMDKEKKTDGPKTNSQTQDKTPDGEKEKSFEGEKWIYCIEIRDHRNQIMADHKFTDLQIGLHPCLAMLSTGAAVRLLDDTLLKGNGNTHIPVMSTKETGDLIISPAEAVSMSRTWGGRLYGMMSLYNKSERPIAFEVSTIHGCFWPKTVFANKILAPKKAWVGLTSKGGRGFTVEWTTHYLDANDEFWKLEDICPNKEQREKHTLEVVTEELDGQYYNAEDCASTAPWIRDEIFHLLRSSDMDDQIEELIYRQIGSTELTQLRENIQKEENSINVLLQLLENASKYNPQDENMMIHHVEKMLKKMEKEDILQTRDNDKKGYTVLHYAALLGSTRLINLLLEKNIRINYLAYVESHRKKLPLEIAIEEKHDGTAKALVIMMSPTSIVNLFWNRDHGRIKLTITGLLNLELTTVLNDPVGQK